MEDHQRGFEEHALKNARALVEKLERADRMSIPMRATLIALAALAVGVVILSVWGWYTSREPELEACVVGARAALLAGQRQRLWREHPYSSSRHIDDLARAEGPAILDMAKADCAARIGTRQAAGPDCLTAALAARTAETERGLRESRPDLSPRTVARLVNEDPRVSAMAKADCAKRSK